MVAAAAAAAALMPHLMLSHSSRNGVSVCLDMVVSVVTGEIPKRFLYVGDMHDVVGESLKSFTSCYLMTMILHTLLRLKSLRKGLVIIGLEAMESEKKN